MDPGAGHLGHQRRGLRRRLRERRQRGHRSGGQYRPDCESGRLRSPARPRQLAARPGERPGPRWRHPDRRRGERSRDGNGAARLAGRGPADRRARGCIRIRHVQLPGRRRTRWFLRSSRDGHRARLGDQHSTQAVALSAGDRSSGWFDHIQPRQRLVRPRW